MLNDIGWILKGIFLAFNPKSPRGRKVRIDRLVSSLGEERDVCAAIVYTRDAQDNYQLSDEELADFTRIGDRLKNGEITLPADRGVSR